MITIVNGYVCMTCCEAAKARKGEDPHKATKEIQNELNKHEKAAAAKFGPAVVFGGSLQTAADPAAAKLADPSLGSASANTVGTSLDLLI